MIQVEIPASVREVFGKGQNRQLRVRNITPAVLYKGGADAVSLQFDAAELYKKLFTIHGRNAVITLQINGDQRPERHVIVKDLQKDALTGTVLHVDFLEIDLDKEIRFEVPLHFTGKARGVDLGGDLQITKTSLQVQGKPLDVPDTIEADITSLDKGGAGLTCGGLTIPANITMLEKQDTLCAIVY